jgi:threonine synthase
VSAFVIGLRCTLCGGFDPPGGDNESTCARCGPNGIREVEYDYGRIAGVFSPASLASDARTNIRRYMPLLPIDEGSLLPPVDVSMSPIIESTRLAKALGVARMWLKNDGLLPTGSSKDRASWVGVVRAAHKGARVIAAASTGNAATSLAGLAASMGLSAHIFVPATAPEAKIAQLCVFGARVFLVKASYDRTYDLCQEAVARFGWYNRSAAKNPYLVEGKKTCGHEIAEQLAPSPPDWVAMSVGDGCSIAGCHKGLLEMQRLGVIDRVPRMLGVQAEGAAPLFRTFREGKETIQRIDDTHTIADSINVGMPRNPIKALRAVRESRGGFVTVSDEAILAAIPKVARLSGVFGEPTAVASVAGIEVARKEGIIDPRSSVLAVITGNGLKDVRTAMRSVSAPQPIEPSIDAVERVVSGER